MEGKKRFFYVVFVVLDVDVVKVTSKLNLRLHVMKVEFEWVGWLWVLVGGVVEAHFHHKTSSVKLSGGFVEVGVELGL